MADPYRVLSTPLRLTGELRVDQLAAIVSADALCRWARSSGRPAELVIGTLSGDLAVQHATERELAREGLDRAMVGRDAFVERVRQYESDARAQLAETLKRLEIDVDLDAAATDTDAITRAARIAFVRLYEEGRLALEDRVVVTCPRCETVVSGADIEPDELPADRHCIELPIDGGTAFLPVVCTAPELLLGTVAIAVPERHPAAGGTAAVPLTDRHVPVVADSGCAEPRLVVPAHDPDALETARRLSLTPILVLDVDGVIRVPGPLEGLSRYAGRAAFVEMLAAAGSLVESQPGTEPAERCRRCGTVLVPRLGRHWFLAMADIEMAAGDAVRQAEVTFAPAAAKDEFLLCAASGGDWCISHQVWAGLPVPVASCLDCGQLAVAADDVDSCGKCMGLLQQEDAVLDARFVAAVAVVAATGWPDHPTGAGDSAPSTTLVVNERGIGGWAVPMAGVCVRLSGALPFSAVAVQDITKAEPVTVLGEGDELATSGDLAAVRTALVAGDLDVEAARLLLAEVTDPPAGPNDLAVLAEACATAFSSGTPGAALAAVASAVSGGVVPGSGPSPAALLEPITAG